MATEKLNFTTRPKNKNLQIKNYKNSHEHRLIRPQTQYKNPQHMYFFMGSSQFINQEIYMYYLVNVDHNSVAVHSTRHDSEGF
jgi:hypothetical protein